MVEAVVHFWHFAVPDELDLRLVRDRLEVRVEDGRLGVARLVVAVAVSLGGGVERVRDLELLLRGQVEVFEQQDRVLYPTLGAGSQHTARELRNCKQR